MLKVIFMSIIFLVPMAEIMASEVVLCHKNKLKNKTSCVVKYNGEQDIKKDMQVVIQNSRGSWVATGAVNLAKAYHFVCTFEGVVPIKKGDIAKVIPFEQESVISYDSAFE